MTSRQQFKVILQAVGAGPPAEVRLRCWLKTALRAHGLRAVSVEEVVVNAPGRPLPPAETSPEPQGSPNGRQGANAKGERYDAS
jgi:hypothetical protein